MPTQMPGQTRWRSILPTALPHPRRVEKKPKLSVFSVLFNTFLVVSALALTVVVLVREEEYAQAQTDTVPAIEAGTAHAADSAGPVQPE